MPANTDTLHTLIGEIYDAAFTPALWGTTLEHLADAVGGAQVMMGIHDFANGAIQVVAPRMDPVLVDSYREHWWTGDRLWQRTNTAPVGEVLHAERFVPRAELERSEFYSEWYRRLDLDAAGLGVNLDVQHGVPSLCGIKRGRGKGHFSADQVALFEALVPHLTRAARVHRQAWALNLSEGLLLAGIARLAQAVLALDHRQHVVYANAPAEALLRAEDGLRLRGGRLMVTDAACRARLAARLAAQASPWHTPSPEDALEIPRTQAGPLRAQLLAMPAQAGELQVQAGWLPQAPPAVLMILEDPDAIHLQRKHALQQRFQLTPAEAELALQIRHGDGRAAAARRLGISAGTARIHLQRVFDKTGVHRQAELVRLLEALDAG